MHPSLKSILNSDLITIFYTYDLENLESLKVILVKINTIKKELNHNPIVKAAQIIPIGFEAIFLFVH